MTDDAPANGTPDPSDRPVPPPAADTSSTTPSSPSTPPAPPATAIVTDPADPAEPAAPTAPADATGPIEPELPVRATRAGTAGAVVALGTGLLAAAVVIAAVRGRDDGGLDWSSYGVGLGATAVLLVIAVLGALAGRRAGGRAREEVVTWPGAVGILATAVMIGVGIDRDDSWVAYLIGGTMVVLAALGYVAARRAAFVVVAILGLALVYGVAFDDFVADSLGDDHPQVIGAVLVSVFVVVVTLLGWALPSRAVSGVVVGVFGLVGILGILASFAVQRFLADMFGGMLGMSGMPGLLGGEKGSGSRGFPASDVWWVVALGGVLAALWALAAAISNHSGFSVLAIALPALGLPLACLALAAEHPTWWSAIAAVAGGVLLLGATLLARLRGRRTADVLGR
ncbi:hypothetical protein FHP29_13225 [Nocardioides albidus]|uniref:Uncharacterized protein n=1 Tax=Nocardioides albidus TaxID=1517589 RepID=A0A5C4VQY9_9ACTN|nr:hypothetical protein [Nocardioides albidus]TNM38251.1 hypothetical protein FHP29_13225 [Nocardioides albidus]